MWERIQVRRTALVDMKNVVTNEGKAKKDGDESKFSLFSTKFRRSFSASPKRVRMKLSEKNKSGCGIILPSKVKFRIENVLKVN